MTFDERVQAVAKKGFTERQARFLTTVMLHAGVCVPRQYARFCLSSASRPMNALSQQMAKPSPASRGVSSGDSSAPQAR